MARPRSDDKRKAIMAAAIRVIAAQGLSAPTAAIAKAAEVSNGSLFTYFATKAELLNQLYVEIKTEMAAASLDGLAAAGDIRAQAFHMWTHWMHWASADPDKRRALAQLGVSDEITPASREAGHKTMAGVAALIERSRAHGPMRAAPLAFVVAMMNAIADTTIDFMIRDKDNAQTHCLAGFEALWRVIG